MPIYIRTISRVLQVSAIAKDMTSKIKKEEEEIYPYVDDIILYAEDTKDTRKNTTRINQQIQHTYRIQNQQYKNNHHLHSYALTRYNMKNEINKTIPFTITPKKDQTVRNKLHQASAIFVDWKLQHFSERNWRYK